MLHRIAIYLALKPGRFFAPTQLLREVSDSWPAVDRFCMQLASVGLADVKICRLKEHVWNCDCSEDLTLEAPDTTDPLGALSTGMLAVVYSASKKLIALVKSGKFLHMIKSRQKRMTEPVNHRVINVLIDKHPEPITVRALKLATKAGESHADLARRLEYLAALGWVVSVVPGWLTSAIKARSYYYYNCSAWQISLSTAGWLRVQRANQDGKPLAMPKPKPRKERLADELAAEKRAANAK